MPKTYTYRLPQVGSTDGETSLNIGLNCDPGVKVYTTLTDVSTPTNQTTILSLSPDSTAQGIGYQILFGGTPVTFGPDFSGSRKYRTVHDDTRANNGRPTYRSANRAIHPHWQDQQRIGKCQSHLHHVVSVATRPQHVLDEQSKAYRHAAA
jgi:type 1 fimbria pilin